MADDAQTKLPEGVRRAIEQNRTGYHFSPGGQGLAAIAGPELIATLGGADRSELETALQRLETDHRLQQASAQVLSRHVIKRARSGQALAWAETYVLTAFPGCAQTFEQQTALQHRALEILTQVAFSSFRDGRMPMKYKAIATDREAILGEVADLRTMGKALAAQGDGRSLVRAAVLLGEADSLAGYAAAMKTGDDHGIIERDRSVGVYKSTGDHEVDSNKHRGRLVAIGVIRDLEAETAVIFGARKGKLARTFAGVVCGVDVTPDLGWRSSVPKRKRSTATPR